MFNTIYRLITVFIITLVFIVSTSLVAAETKPITKNLSNYIQQGKQLYDLGQPREAITIWQQAIPTYAEQGDLRSQAIGYNYMAIAYQDLGEWLKAEKSLAIALQLVNTIDDRFLYAQVLHTQGNLQIRMGETERAIATWQSAAAIYRQLNAVEPLLRSQINQAQALRSLGYRWQARQILESANTELEALPDSELKAKALQSLAIDLRARGEFKKSQAVLTASLEIAKKLSLNSQINSLKLSLANTALTRDDYQTAISLYQQIRATAQDKPTQIKATVKLIAALLKTDADYTAVKLLPQAIAELEDLPTSIDKIYAQVNLASILIARRQEGYSLSNRIPYMLQSAMQEARQLANPRLEAAALGELGHYYEQDGKWELAQTATKQAILLVDNTPADDLTIQWYWQQGRIYQAMGETEKAIAAYQAAITILQSLRQDLVAIDSTAQFSFTDRIEPLYRQYLQLLMQDLDILPPIVQQEHLVAVQQGMESLHLAELENFWHATCLTSSLKPIAEIDPQAAVIYPLVLEDRLEVILSLPGQPLQHYGTAMDISQQKQVRTNLHQALNKTALPTAILPPAQQLYDWLIRPGAAALNSQNIDTIVFVLDDWLRNVPMSVLHDGNDYLIQKYNLALTPGLQLLTTPRQENQKLPIIATEVLTKSTFTPANLKAKLANSPSSVVHLAAYGQFSSQIEDTFLVTGEDRLNAKDLTSLLQNQQNSLELLVFSSSETAPNDQQATVGMTGIAVGSGASTTIASLWRIGDRSTTKLMTEFYQLLTQANLSKAAALRQAQLTLLDHPQYHHPYYWSPFVLIGNWQ